MQEADDLYYVRARYYDASTGRFISEDPAGFVDGPNLYIYAGNNPILYVDPTGEFGVVGFLVGGALDLGVQLAANGGNFSEVDWADVGISAVSSAILPGALSAIKGSYKSYKAINVLSGQLSRAKAPSRIAKLQGRINAHQARIRDHVQTQLIVQGAKYGAKRVLDYTTNPSTSSTSSPGGRARKIH
jgi:hypothetical protein